VIPSFIEAARTQRSPIIYGDGLQTRDFVYVESVAEANVRAAMAPNAAGEVINVAGGEQTSVLQLLHTICQAAGSNSQPQFLPERSGEVRHSRAEVSKANALLGLKTPYSLEEAIRKTVAASIPVLVS
jgi:nucleoside-diphosphate-sugar epimerase